MALKSALIEIVFHHGLSSCNLAIDCFSVNSDKKLLFLLLFDNAKIRFFKISIKKILFCFYGAF